MDSYESPFLTFTNAQCSSSYLGGKEEMEALNRRTEALDIALRTGQEFDTVLDMLEEDGQDPIEYVEQVGQDIELIIASHLVPDDIWLWQKYR